MPMKPEFKKVWLEALRSGEFKQGFSTLRRRGEDGYHFCCLGVACTAWKHAQLGDGFVVEELFDGSMEVLVGEIAESGELPDEALDEVGLTSDEQSLLLTMNDHEGKSFPEIADYIEANL